MALVTPGTNPFPLNRNSSNASSGRTTPTPSPTDAERRTIELSTSLDQSTRYAFADLLAAILRMDFIESSDENKEFSEETLELMMKHLKLPEKTNRSIRAHLVGEGTTDDLVALITMVKSDAFLQKNGMTVLLADMVTIFVDTGRYDCRYRVLMRHVSALLAVHWDAVEEIEDTLTHLLIEQQYDESE
uniref:Uncharacterized protein n=1 Tax=Plectus sambesii TaxID=2011161 RepID=A0A914VM74_9BILA